jgi:hypothetical protein
MVFALIWLTVSLPFVNLSQQVSQEIMADSESERSGSNGLANTIEEKTETGSNSLSEYLHDHSLHAVKVPALVNSYKVHPNALYSAFHPEMVLPPPEA